MRYERKFITAYKNRFQVEQNLKLHPALFTEIFQSRKVNNIYFDTACMSFYTDNLTGNPRREKYRLRWYGNNNGRIESPVLEIKKKDGFLGTKISFPLDVHLDLQAGICNLHGQLIRSAIPQNLAGRISGLRPVLYNAYIRRYFLSYDRKFRVTVDDSLQFGNVSQAGCLDGHRVRKEGVVIEVKYDQKFDSEAREITSFLPYRYTKFSKYEEGIRLITPLLNI